MRSLLIALPGAAVGLGLLVGGPAHAGPVSPGQAATVTNATMTWNISSCAFDPSVRSCTSLNERSEVDGDVSRGQSGWVFTGGDGVVSADGAISVAWDAAVLMGNTTRGNYSITLSDPVLMVDANGAGSIEADVTWQIATDTPTTTQDVTIVTFTGGDSDADFASTPAGFDPQFVQALDPQLQPWFTQTGGSADAAKVPGMVSFDRWVPTLTVTLPATYLEKKPRVKDKRFTVLVSGTGFDPSAKANPAVAGMYVTFGPNPTAIADGYANPQAYFRVRYLPAGPNSQGEFTQSIQVKGTYTKAGVTYNGRFGQPLGVSTWAAHARATTAWDAFSQVSFRK